MGPEERTTIEAKAVLGAATSTDKAQLLAEMFTAMFPKIAAVINEHFPEASENQKLEHTMTYTWQMITTACYDINNGHYVLP